MIERLGVATEPSPESLL